MSLSTRPEVAAVHCSSAGVPLAQLHMQAAPGGTFKTGAGVYALLTEQQYDAGTHVNVTIIGAKNESYAIARNGVTLTQWDLTTWDSAGVAKDIEFYVSWEPYYT